MNDTKQYVNQYYDVYDLPETKSYEPGRTCNVSCVAMITGEDVNDVLKWFIGKYGWNDKFQWEENLIAYLVDKGYTCEPLTEAAYPKPRVPSSRDMNAMKAALDEGKIVLYHKTGHYQLLVGYDDSGYMFNDPAGDRQLKQSDRARESGHMVHYPTSMVMSETIYGRCWAIS